MQFKTIFSGMLLILGLSLLSSLSYASNNTICSLPDCKIYTVTNPIDNVKLNVSDWSAKTNAKGPALLFIHGFPHDQFLWLNQINNDDLRGNFRVITLDWRGFGLSNKPENSASYSEQLLGSDIDAVLTALDVDKVVLIGHSAGGLPLISYIKQFGTSKVRSLVLTDAIADNGVFPYIPGSVFGLIVQGATATTADDFMKYTQDFLTLSTFSPLEPGLNNFLLAHDLLMTQGPRLALLGALSSVNLNALSTVQVPVLIVWGQSDNVILPGAANYLHGIIPNNQLALIPNAGHCPMVEKPDEFNKVVSNFVKKNN